VTEGTVSGGAALVVRFSELVLDLDRDGRGHRRALGGATGLLPKASIAAVPALIGGTLLLGLGAGNLNGTQTVNGVARVATFGNLRIDGGILNVEGQGEGSWPRVLG
jgi:hypothetical protein